MVFEKLSNALWLFGFFPLFFLCSICLCRGLPALFRQARRREGRAESAAGRLSSSQAVSAALAATVGTGNIVGTAQAICMGGPGALFWIWAASLMGCSVKTAEIYFGLRRRLGPMGYIASVLGPGAAWLSAASCCASALLVGNIAQIHTAASSLNSLMPAGTLFSRVVFGLTLTAVLALCLSEGAPSAGKACEVLVPVMFVLYLLFSCGILLRRRAFLIPALRSILKEAFRPSAALGAAGGLGFRSALLWGLRRGCFSNEAGLGTAASVHAFAAASQPARHALWGFVEVGLDSLLMCTLTGLVILCSGIALPYGSLPGTELILGAFSSVYGLRLSSVFLAVSMLFFCFSTVLGTYLPGNRAAAWIGLDEKRFRFVYLLCSLSAAFFPVEMIWYSADLLNILLAFPNLLALTALSSRFPGASIECGKAA